MCSEDFDVSLEKLLEDIRKNYVSHLYQVYKDVLSPVAKTMISDFNENLKVKEGSKYSKIVTSNGSVWGFVVSTENDTKFKKGDILMAASWKTPARNSARGNILEGNYNISWTGPSYLR